MKDLLHKIFDFIISIFTYRRPGEPRLPRKREATVAFENLAGEDLAAGTPYRTVDREQVYLMLDIMKSVINLDDGAATEDPIPYVEQLLDENISLQFKPVDIEGFLEHYRKRELSSIRLSGACHFLKMRSKPVLRMQLARSLFAYGYKHGYDADKLREIFFTCKMLDLPVEEIRLTETAIRKSCKDTSRHER